MAAERGYGTKLKDVLSLLTTCCWRSILALSTEGSAKQIVKEVTVARNGVEAWVRLRERFSETTGATSYAEIFKFKWTSPRSFEDKWRECGAKVSQLPKGSLSGAAKEALVIEVVNLARQQP